jgi:urease accessory protein
MDTITATSMAEGSTLPLLVWLSPAFPVGSFAYSHGLEWAVESGDVTDAASLRTWIEDLVRHGSGRNDSVVLAVAYRATVAGDTSGLAEAAELAVALQPSRERHLETTQQGEAFAIAVEAAWPTPAFAALRQAHDGPVAYPVAVAVAAAGHGVPLPATLEGYLTAFVSALVSACVRLGPIGQTEGQRVIAALMPAIRDMAAALPDATLDDLGAATLRSDLASMLHETQYSRLFRS